MSFYQKHLFFCTNIKASPKKCCGVSDGKELAQYAKEKLKQLNMHGKGKLRISTSGCLGRCAGGPCIVIYPDDTWYTYNSKADIDEIIEKHLLLGQVVSRLALDQ